MALFPLGVTVELLINGVWTDISSSVRQRTTIQITGGKSEQADTSQPAALTLELDNRSGNFSPYNTGGAYYPYLKRNVQVRVSVSDTSASGNSYSGYRYWGEVHRWPPVNDISGRDVTVTVTASGPLRRIRAHGGKGSALARYYGTLTGSFAPVAYWPCEEDPDTTIVGAGIDGGTNMTVTVGKPKWKHISDFNGSAPIGVVNKSTWDGLTGSFGSSGNDVYSAPGTYKWVASTTTVDCRCWGSGGGGQNGASGCAGGGGELAEETALAVTPGTAYTFTIPAGGPGGAGASGTGHDGTAGASTVFAGDAVTVTAHGGAPGTGGGGGAGGTGSANTVHHPGGAGGSNPSNFTGGAGGGGSGGTAATGNAGSNPSGTSGASGGAAVTNGGKGGNGGHGGTSPAPGNPGGTPGGGGGGGGDSSSSGYNWAGGSGAPGQVQLIYTPATLPVVNVIRFIKLTPKHGGNPGKVILRAFTSSSVIDHVDVTYATGGKLRLQGFNSSNVQQFDSTAQSWGVDGQTVMVSIELQNSGANIAWAFKAIIPGSSTLLGSASGTVTTAAVGNVSEVLVSPNADITKTAIGHISVQYAFISLRKVSAALNGHSTEMGIDRFIRLANEQALSNVPEFNEKADHWGFEWCPPNFLTTAASGSTANSDFEASIGTWTQTGNCAIVQTTAQAHGGTHSLQMTASSSASMQASNCLAANITTQGLPCSPGDTLTASAWFRTQTTARSVNIGIDWYTSAGSLVSVTRGSNVTDSSSAWTQATAVLVAPATAAFARADVQVVTPANTEVHYVDDVTLCNPVWAGTNCTLSIDNSAFTPVDTDTTPNLTLYPAWPADATNSLLLTCNGGANPAATSPTGTAGQPVNVGDIVSVNAEVYVPAAKNNMFIGVLWYTSGGAACTHAEDDSADVAYAAGELKTLRVTATAPTGAAFFAVKIGDHETPANGQLIYTDNVRVHPRMGPQTRKDLHKFLEEIHDLDQGILKEAKELWGLKYRTRIRLINQTPAVTLDYSAGTLSPPLAPVIDDKQTKNDVTVHRHKGSKIRVTLDSGDMSVTEPPTGAGRHKHHLRVAAEKDEQLAALAAHLLGLGTVTNERYPTVTVNLARAGILNNAVAPLMSAIASVEIGDVVQLANLPAWFPATTSNQQVIGYTETLNAYEWTITWNCIPDAGFELATTAIRRW